MIGIGQISRVRFLEEERDLWITGSKDSPSSKKKGFHLCLVFFFLYASLLVHHTLSHFHPCIKTSFLFTNPDRSSRGDLALS